MELPFPPRRKVTQPEATVSADEEPGWAQRITHVPFERRRCDRHRRSSEDAACARFAIGDVVNLATKIQGQARPGGIYLGQVAVQNLHRLAEGLQARRRSERLVVQRLEGRVLPLLPVRLMI